MVATLQHGKVSATHRAWKSSLARPRPAAPGRRQEARPEAAAPWQYVNNSIAAGEAEADPVVMRRRDRLALRSVLRRVSKLKTSPRGGSAPQYSLRKCGVVRCSADQDVRLRVVDGVGYAEGVVHCGSVWCCPCCGAKIRSARAEVYAASAARWLEAGNSMVAVTLTFPHDMGMRLAPMWDLVSDGVGRLTSNAGWRKLKAQFGGGMWYRRAIEQTYGCNGWHPHAHLVIYVRGEVGAEGLAAIAIHFRRLWAGWVTSHGYRLPSDQHGVKVEAVQHAADAAEYLVKTQDGHSVGHELARGDLKTGQPESLTPLELLAAFARTGDKQALTLWHEFEQASKGRRAITQSQGLPEVLGETEQTDQELADADAGGEDVAVVDSEQWDGVIGEEIEAELFEAVARGGLPAVNDVLQVYRLGRARAPERGDRDVGGLRYDGDQGHGPPGRGKPRRDPPVPA